MTSKSSPSPITCNARCIPRRSFRRLPAEVAAARRRLLPLRRADPLLFGGELSCPLDAVQPAAFHFLAHGPVVAPDGVGKLERTGIDHDDGPLPVFDELAVAQ